MWISSVAPGHPNAPEDRGSVMTLVLVFTIISALIVVPMLNYAITVLRVNSVSVDKREELESVSQPPSDQ
jgi:hypothetical protein